MNFKLNLVLFIFVLTPLSDANQLLKKSEIAEQLYKKLLKRQRAEQLAAIKSFQKLRNYEKKYQMITLMAEKVFTIMQDSRAKIEASHFIPGVSEFPTDDNIRDALSNIIENSALFAEIILRLPEISVSVLKTNNNWDILLQWGIAYCYQVKYLLDNSTIKILSLASQELNYVPRDLNYANPYRKNKQESDGNEEEPNQLQSKNVKKKKKKLQKGPRLHDEF
ncbi:unnamed protein product [Ceutorhynchus assimilis]|uniref:Coiled-coil domain-containing protein 134 n=1 Tax=Ceutorhynchus assimilis TaxID=467358 RepID=A0A9N9QL16_9CUCU|nr:unnamed protein product [Ceutorhynchus assimilis]